MPSCHSTNTIALEMLKTDNAVNGAIVITDEQTAGKGQRGNQWLAEPHKNLTFSIIANVSNLNISQIFNLNMAVCLGIIETLHKIEPSKSTSYKLKWPNDIYFSENKLGGILIETILKADQTLWAVIGIGLNVNQTEFGRLNATSVKNIHSQTFNLQELLEQIALAIESNTNLKVLTDFESLKSRYLTHLYKYNSVSNFKKINGELFEGRIKDIDNSGKIIIEVENTIEVFNKQEIQFIR